MEGGDPGVPGELVQRPVVEGHRAEAGLVITQRLNMVELHVVDPLHRTKFVGLRNALLKLAAAQVCVVPGRMQTMQQSATIL
jgi:hypothetical protein